MNFQREWISWTDLHCGALKTIGHLLGVTTAAGPTTTNRGPTPSLQFPHPFQMFHCSNWWHIALQHGSSSAVPHQCHCSQLVTNSEQIEHEIRVELARCCCARSFFCERIDDHKYKVSCACLSVPFMPLWKIWCFKTHLHKFKYVLSEVVG